MLRRTFKRKSEEQPSVLQKILAESDRTYQQLPLNYKLAVKKICQALPEYGLRKLKRKGTGSEFFQATEYNRNEHSIRQINPRLSQKHHGGYIAVESEEETRQQVYLWRDGSESMNLTPAKGELYTKKEAAEIMMLALAHHITKNEDSVAVLDQKGLYRGGNVRKPMATKLASPTIITGDTPVVKRKLPRNSVVVLFSDFFTDLEELGLALNQLKQQKLDVHMVMTLDPEELDFTYKRGRIFYGETGEGSLLVRKPESRREKYLERMKDHITSVDKICKSLNFNLVVQRTDEPLSNAVLSIYGLSPKVDINQAIAPKADK